MDLPGQNQPMSMDLEASGIQIRADTIRAKILQDVEWSDDYVGIEPGRALSVETVVVKCFQCSQPGCIEVNGYEDSMVVW